MKNNQPKSLIKFYWGWPVVLAVFLAIAVVVWTQVSSNEPTSVSDADTFRSSYSAAPEDHVFRVGSAEDAIELMDLGTGVLFLGFPQCPWCQTLVPHLDAAAKDVGINEVLYFDVREDRTANSTTYQQFVDKLEPYLDKDEDGEPRIYVPHVVVVNEGEVVGNYKIAFPEDGANVTPETYWTDEAIETARAQLKREMGKIST